MMTLALLLTSSAQAFDQDDFSFDVSGSIFVQGFGAPYIRDRQDARGFLVPSGQAEGEVRYRQTALRARLGLGAAIIATNRPLSLAFDSGLMLLSYQDRPDHDWNRFGGLELGFGHAFSHPRLYAGPVIGTGTVWGDQLTSGKVAFRAHLNLAYELGSRNDWTTLSPGPALGIQGGLSVVFSPTEF